MRSALIIWDTTAEIRTCGLQLVTAHLSYQIVINGLIIPRKETLVPTYLGTS